MRLLHHYYVLVDFRVGCVRIGYGFDLESRSNPATATKGGQQWEIQKQKEKRYRKSGMSFGVFNHFKEID